jgi:hypothetical protein
MVIYCRRILGINRGMHMELQSWLDLCFEPPAQEARSKSSLINQMDQEAHFKFSITNQMDKRFWANPKHTVMRP